MVRASLIYMGIGFLLGALMLADKGIPLFAGMRRSLNPHVELMIFGWTIQLAMGIAFFALPRFSNRDDRYGAVRLGWWSFSLLNVGLLLTASGQWFVIGALVLVGRIAILLGLLLYAVMIFPRVKPFAVG